jgi:hypothetical protein
MASATSESQLMHDSATSTAACSVSSADGNIAKK